MSERVWHPPAASRMRQPRQERNSMSSCSLKGLMAPVLAIAVTAAACGGSSKQEAAPSGSAAPSGAPASAVDPNTAGNITGAIKLEGQAPQAEGITMKAGPV